MEISKMLTVSTTHITESIASYLDNKNRSALIVYPKHQYGWFLNVGYEGIENELPDVPYALANLIKFAKKNGCNWLCLDCDGGELDGFATYEW